MRVLIVEDEPYLADAIRDGLRLETIAADIANELVLRLRALSRRPADATPPVLEFAGLRLDPFRRELYRDGRYVAVTRKQFAVPYVLMAARGGVVSAEDLLAKARDENADPFTNAVRITISTLRRRLGDPWLIHTVPGVGYRVGPPEGVGERDDPSSGPAASA